MSNFVTNLVLDKIKSGIENHANMNGLSKYDLYVRIQPVDEDFNPAFVLCNRTKPIKDISFGDFVGMRKFFGFDVAGEGESWIKKFLIYSANDNSLELYEDHFYFIRINNETDELQAWMYKEDKPYREISIDYILKTR